eukprot:scaffold814_cov100-Cylindrotheca_fusiformis.AAC.7
MKGRSGQPDHLSGTVLLRNNFYAPYYEKRNRDDGHEGLFTVGYTAQQQRMLPRPYVNNRLY